MARFLAFLKFAAAPNWNFVGQALGPEVGICAGICGIVFPYPHFVERYRLEAMRGVEFGLQVSLVVRLRSQLAHVSFRTFA